MLREVSGLELSVPVKETPVQRMLDQWAEAYKLNIPRLIEKLRAKIPDLKAYLAKMANPAIQAWQNVINPAFKSKSGRNAANIREAQQANINRAYTKYEASFAHLFETVDEEEAKRLKEIIDNKKDVFAEGMSDRTLRLTGDKIRGRGVAPLASMWLTGDVTVPDMLRSGDTIISGGPVDISKPGLKPQLKSGLNSRLIQSGIAIIYSEMNATRIADENIIINSFLSALRDETVYEEFTAVLTPLKSHCGFFMRDGQLYLRIQVVAL